MAFQAFFSVASNDIFAHIRPNCGCRGSEHNIVYWNSVFCDLMEDFNPELEVLTMPRQETFGTHLLSLLADGVIFLGRIILGG